MKILLIAPPPSDKRSATAAEALFQLADSLKQEGTDITFELVAGFELPGPLAFGTRNKLTRSLAETKADLLVFSSPQNFLPVPGLRHVLLLTRHDPAAWKKIRRVPDKIHGILTDSNYLKGRIMTAFPGTNIQVQPLALPEPIADEPVYPAYYGDHDWVDYEGDKYTRTRKEFTSGNEYFYYGGMIEPSGEWEKILQAYSRFRKWQQSSVGLLLGGPISEGFEGDFAEKLAAYRNRQFVYSHPRLKAGQKQKIIASAFGVIADPTAFEGRMDTVEAFRSGIPVISQSSEIADELYGDASLRAVLDDPESLAPQMIAMYRNEELNQLMAARGRSLSTSYTTALMCRQLADCLRSIAKG